MYWLIETTEQFEKLKGKDPGEYFLLPICRHPEVHPGIYTPILLYIYDRTQKKDYLINFFHSQALTLDIVYVREWIKTLGNIYTPDRKAFNHFCYNKNTKGLDLIDIPEDTKTIPSITQYTQKFNNDEDLNSIIPIVKHLEQCREIYKAYSSIILKYETNSYNNDISDVFYHIESNALKVGDNFEEYFTLKRPFLSKINNWIFTQYNLNTNTGRPSNAFNNLNFAALNKENNCRSVFIPRNDFLIEIDITAYHPTLIAQMVGYNSPTGDIYEDFANMYNMSREEAKNLVFQQIYGHIYEKYKHFEFFKLTKLLVEKLWDTYELEGKIQIPETGKVFRRTELPTMNPQKLFNYVIQHKETYENTQLLKQIIKLLNNKESKIVLYVYDAFVIDTAKEDKIIIQQILEIFKQKQFKVKTSYGTNYNTLLPL